MSARIASLLVFAISVGGCASGHPAEDALKAYARALADGDVEQIRALSSTKTRAGLDDAQLKKWQHKNPRLFDAAIHRAVQADRGDKTMIFGSGENRVRMVLEDGEWRVAEGGLLLARFDTPEAALETFFFAAAGHLELLRESMPEEAARRYATDYELGVYLHSIQGRIEAARDEIGPLHEGRATIDGDRARISYGEHKAAELVLEGERWKVVDVE